jgi:hypothetical protein
MLLEQLVTSLLSTTTLYSKMSTSRRGTAWEQAVRTHPVDKLLEQHCYKSEAAGLLQLVTLVRFYVCSSMF